MIRRRIWWQSWIIGSSVGWVSSKQRAANEEREADKKEEKEEEEEREANKSG